LQAPLLKYDTTSHPNQVGGHSASASGGSGTSSSKLDITEINRFFDENGSKRQKFYSENGPTIKKYIEAFEAAVKGGAYKNDNRFDLITNFIQRFKEWKSQK
jgi:hypothetical protein